MSGSPPRISIVTPSYNQGTFLEETIRSVLDQGYPDLEYVVMDGGSADGSVDVIKRHADRLAHWTSEPDKGQYDAIRRGFERTTGEVMAWINSDDKHLPWTLSVVGEIFARFPEVEWLTSAYPLTWDGRGRAVACTYGGGFDRARFLRGANLTSRHHNARFIQQESTFWRRSLWERAGRGPDPSFRLAGDFDLWARFFQHADLYAVNTPLGGFRRHGEQKTAKHMDAYVREAEDALARHGGRRWGALRGRLHWALEHAVGGRPLEVQGPAARLLMTVGLARPTRAIAFREGEWKIVTDYTV